MKPTDGCRGKNSARYTRNCWGMRQPSILSVSVTTGRGSSTCGTGGRRCRRTFSPSPPTVPHPPHGPAAAPTAVSAPYPPTPFPTLTARADAATSRAVPTDAVPTDRRHFPSRTRRPPRRPSRRPPPPPNREPMPAEIYINMDMAHDDAEKHGIPPTDRIIFLAIHGMLHLLGYDHGDTMEKKEHKYATKYIRKYI